MSDATPDTDRRALALEVVHLAWPAVLQGLVTTVVLFTDRLLLGRYSTDAIASMGISGPLVWSIFSVTMAFGAGIVAVIGRAVGARDAARARSTLRAVLGLAVALGVVVVAVGLPTRTLIADAIAGEDTSAIVRALSVDYLGIVLAAAPIALLATAASTALQAAGDTRSPMIAGAIAGAINLALTWLLVYGHLGAPELGVRGAAIGTAVAMAIQAAYVIAVLRSGRGVLTLRAPTASAPVESERSARENGARHHARAPGIDPERVPPSGSDRGRHELEELAIEGAPSDWRDALRPVLKISGPALGEKVVYHTAYMLFTALIGHLGAAAMAAHQALIAIESVSFIAASGFGVAAGALVAQKLGAKKPEEASGAGWLAAWLGAAALSVVSVVFLIWPEPLVRLFVSGDPEVVALGAKCLRIAAIAQPLMAITDALAGGLRGAGDTRTPMFAAIVGPVVVRLSACWLLAYPLGLGLVGIWIGSTLDWGVRAVWMVVAFGRGRWRTLHA